MKRREFLEQTAAAATLSCFPANLCAIERETQPGRIERRAYGKTGEKLSIVAFGGFVLNESTTEQAREWIRLAYEAGVNHFDVAQSMALPRCRWARHEAVPEDDLSLVQDSPAQTRRRPQPSWTGRSDGYAPTMLTFTCFITSLIRAKSTRSSTVVARSRRSRKRRRTARCGFSGSRPTRSRPRWP